jgi:hypothetical protein
MPCPGASVGNYSLDEQTFVCLCSFS